MDLRLQQLQDWLTQVVQSSFSISPIAGDASFRRYFRVQCADTSYIAMDAPSEQEDCRSFVAMARLLKCQGVAVPHIIAESLAAGFLLLSDLGDGLYLPALNADTADTLYTSALTALITLQQTPTATLPLFDAALLRRELNLFPDWFLAQQLQIQLSADEQTLINSVFDLLIENALEQPQVFVHRDYHSRNLLLLPQQQVGILDFQDAVVGPVTYDAVSLLRDCYIAWPQADMERWAGQFYQQQCAAGILKNIAFNQYLRWFDLMGLQRHLKVIGIFSRLNIRDHKPRYLQDIPRIFHYVFAVCEKYPELAALQTFLQQRINLTQVAA